MATIGSYKRPVRDTFDVIDVEGELFELRGSVDGYTILDYVDAADPSTQTTVKHFMSICLTIIRQALGDEEHARFRSLAEKVGIDTDTLITLANDLFAWSTGNPTTLPSDSSEESEVDGSSSNDSFSSLYQALNAADSSGKHAATESIG